MSNRVSLGQCLKREMKKQGIKVPELARAAGVKTSFLYDVLSGKSANPSTITLAKVARHLGVDLDGGGLLDFFADRVVEHELDGVSAGARELVSDRRLIRREGFQGGAVAVVPPALSAAGGAVVEGGDGAFDRIREIRDRLGRLDRVADQGR